MKIKLDENLPGSLINILQSFGHDVDSVAEEGLSGNPDDKIWIEAQKENRFLITQDLDFSDIRRYIPGTHSGIMLVRLHKPTRMSLFFKIKSIFETEEVELWEQCFVVVTDYKIRVIRPPNASN